MVEMDGCFKVYAWAGNTEVYARASAILSSLTERARASARLSSLDIMYNTFGLLSCLPRKRTVRQYSLSATTLRELSEGIWHWTCSPCEALFSVEDKLVSFPLASIEAASPCGLGLDVTLALNLAYPKSFISIDTVRLLGLEVVPMRHGYSAKRDLIQRLRAGRQHEPFDILGQCANPSALKVIKGQSSKPLFMFDFQRLEPDIRISDMPGQGQERTSLDVLDILGPLTFDLRSNFDSGIVKDGRASRDPDQKVALLLLCCASRSTHAGSCSKCDPAGYPQRVSGLGSHQVVSLRSIPLHGIGQCLCIPRAQNFQRPGEG
ncbi:hypothetical protein N656DRAFT_541976 [Canariomyces notabilis]|uniref:Uncharacterized protein n=1 Tax=Canariomyces notabilis TaxID=2074819 RepID=A0AAN6YUM7_9PEZI|nr:hypothetical protein N656DRAFT_541976 [Canariomyces arenarius]